MSDGPKSGSKTTHYEIDGDTLIRKTEFCPKCGPGVFMGVHSDRKTCGRCGHSEKTE